MNKILLCLMTVVVFCSCENVAPVSIVDDSDTISDTCDCPFLARVGINYINPVHSFPAITLSETIIRYWYFSEHGASSNVYKYDSSVVSLRSGYNLVIWITTEVVATNDVAYRSKKFSIMDTLLNICKDTVITISPCIMQTLYQDDVSGIANLCGDSIIFKND
jgi:hypothetical protein